MTKFLVRVIVGGITLWFTSFLPGITITSTLTLPISDFIKNIVMYLILGFIFALINSLVKPILQFFALPITVATLGFFHLIVNCGLLYLLSMVSHETPVHYDIQSFIWALIAAVLIGTVNALMSKFFKTKN